MMHTKEEARNTIQNFFSAIKLSPSFVRCSTIIADQCPRVGLSCLQQWFTTAYRKSSCCGCCSWQGHTVLACW